MKFPVRELQYEKYSGIGRIYPPLSFPHLSGYELVSRPTFQIFPALVDSHRQLTHPDRVPYIFDKSGISLLQLVTQVFRCQL